MAYTKLIDPSSHRATKSELDLFSVRYMDSRGVPGIPLQTLQTPPTVVAIDSANWVPIQPTVAISADSQGPYLFQVHRDFEFLDMSASYIHMRLRIVKANGGDIGLEDVADLGLTSVATPYEAAPIPNIGGSFFRTLRIWFNSKIVYDSGPNYAYRSYIEDTLNYTTLTKDTMLEAAGYYRDKGTAMNTIANESYQKRGAMAANSRVFDIIAPIHADCFSHDRLLPNNLEVRLEAYKNSDNFLIQTCAETPGKYAFEVDSMTWMVRKVAVLDSISVALERKLATQPARYPIRRVSCRTFHLDGGRRSIAQLQLSNGQLPRRVVLCMVKSGAYNGDFKLTPFNFEHFTLNRIQLVAGGVPMPRLPLELDFVNKRYVQAYMSLFANLNTGFADTSNGVTYADFANGYTFLVFDLTPDSSDDWHCLREGSITLDMSFDQDLPKGGVTLMAYFETDNLLMIDRHRQPYFNYAE
jgi:hypothetical protein